MKMKKIILSLWACLCLWGVRAEDVIQVVPFKAEPGMTTDDMACFSVKMNNTNIYWAFQLDFLLPDGMVLDDTGGLNPFELNLDRFPHSSRGGIVTFKHGVAWNKLSNGWYRVVVSPNDATRIEGTEGEIMKVYYLTSPDMNPCLFPIYVKGTVLTITGTSDVKPGPSASYFTIGESPLATEPVLDLSSLTGYWPSWAVEQMNEEMQANERLVEVDMTGTDSIGAELKLPNPNAFCYVKAECGLPETEEGNAWNCVRTDGASCSCPDATLDEDYPFGLSRAVEAGNVTYRRNPFTADWNTLCLPFALSGQTVTETFGDGAGLYRFDGLRDGLLCFSPAGDGEANTPYLLYVAEKADAGELVFSDVSLSPMSSVPEVADGGARFLGNYDGYVSAAGYYGVTPDARIALAGESATIRGFKAFFDLSEVANANALRMHIDWGEETGISETKDTPSLRVDVYTLDGVCVRRQVARSEACEGLPKGIYIIGKQKVIVK